MKRRVLITGLVFILLTACVAAPPVSTVTSKPTAIITPTSIPTLTPTATPVVVDLRVLDKPVICRFGPGTVYELMDELSEGESASVVGRNESLTWLYIRDPGNPNGFCWVSADLTETHGAVKELPVVQSPASTVTDASLRVEPDRIVVSCDKFPQTIFLEAEITTNGPTFVTWRWEASTGVLSENTIRVFEQSGKQVINDYYRIGGPNDYWVKLHILAPNEIVKQVNVPVSCSPQ
jgi:hypothetical protein